VHSSQKNQMAVLVESVAPSLLKEGMKVYRSWEDEHDYLGGSAAGDAAARSLVERLLILGLTGAGMGATASIHAVKRP